ncbi:hypothetical protein [Achromobacter sp. UMC46]|uniref:hypothetical protein n=1 Tax=Achromobacter sp. UMC46 TaxID=1862319 RepID=UPI001601866A|nr:hypothetical protein [Achromobacter sp. UMC46]
MSWLTLSIALIVVAAVGAVLLRHPGVVLYDWIVTRRAAARARPAVSLARPVLAGAPGPQRPAERAEPAALAG